MFVHVCKCVCMCVCRIEDATFRSRVLGEWELPCVQGSVLEMKEDFQGSSVNLPVRLDTHTHTH